VCRFKLNYIFSSLCTFGSIPVLDCTSGALNSISWYFNLRGSVTDGTFVAISELINLDYIENIITFLNLLAENDSAIVGSVALKVMLNGLGLNWAPQDLNIAVPHGGLQSFSDFLWGLQYQLSGTGICSRFIGGAFTHSIYVNPAGNAVMVTEALSTDSFFTVVVGSGHTGLMNFVSSEHLGCLYPTQTLKEHVAYAYRCSLGMDAHHNLQMRGFDIITSSHNHPSNDPFLCPVTHHQLSGVRLFEWTKCTLPSNFLTRSYSWSLGDECLNYSCLVKALE